MGQLVRWFLRAYRNLLFADARHGATETRRWLVAVPLPILRSLDLATRWNVNILDALASVRICVVDTLEVEEVIELTTGGITNGI